VKSERAKGKSSSWEGAKEAAGLRGK